MSDLIQIFTTENKLQVLEQNNELIIQEQGSNQIEIQSVGAQGPIGIQGPVGPQGPAGQGVPVGGTANQALTKIDSTNYNTQWSTINKSFVGLGNVDNTSDLNKPISTATQNALNQKIDSDTALVYALMFG